MGVISNGTTLLDAGAIDSGVPTGSMTLISTTTASSSSTVSITGLNSTYKEYVIKMIQVHPGTDDSRLVMQGSTDGSNYGVTMTSTAFRALNHEDNSARELAYQASADVQNGTAFTRIGVLGLGADDDENGNGQLHLYDPASTVFVKHFMSTFSETGAEPRQVQGFASGYFNTTSAITAVQFKFDQGTVGAGTFKLYGIK